MEITEYPQNKTTAFSSATSFDAAQRMAMALCSSDMVPKNYRGKQNMGNVLIALEIAQRIGASPMSVMQNLYIIHGKPSWSSSFIIAAINQTGRFKPLQFRFSGENNNKECVAYTEDFDGNIYESPAVSMKMAREEGWSTKIGSKWKTMPDLMLSYRAAAFFGRLYAPEILMGMYTEYEQQDIESNEKKEIKITGDASEQLLKDIQEKDKDDVINTDDDGKEGE